MSLLSFIEPKNCSQEELESILNEIECPEILGIEPSPRKKWFDLVKNTDAYVWIWLHDLLTDNGDWNADSWDFDQKGLDALVYFMEKFSENIGKEFSFQAIWASDNIEINLELTIGELTQIIRSDNIGTKTKYLIKPIK